MLTRLAVFLLESSPAMRRALWRWWYGRLATKLSSPDWTFMNYGFVPPDAPGPALEPGDEPDRLCIQLYHRVASGAPLAGRTVLEVGSGRGGGASFITRHHRPARYVGADFSPQAVAFCRRRHASVANLEFVTGDAESLPFPDASFDAIVNVESSHCYGNVAKFFQEVARVTRPGGHFLYADFRTAADMQAIVSGLAGEPGWRVVQEEDVTAGVANAMQADDERKRALIEQNVPAKFRHLFGEFAGLVGGQIYGGFRSGKLRYCRLALQRL
ncbi:MAG TPA: methyltransferase domain-containing protein [Opitutaceae bacterium]|nr:methyltransferase domain-containing protein [Opitutaceae bacterium]